MRQQGNSGHPGLAPWAPHPMAIALWTRAQHQPGRNPDNGFNRDRFVLSAPRLTCCSIPFSIYRLPTSVGSKDLKPIPAVGSKTPGHPETFEDPGVEVTTGPLRSGTRQRGGPWQIAEGPRAAKLTGLGRSGRPFTYVIMGDGWPFREGISVRPPPLAGHLGLGK